MKPQPTPPPSRDVLKAQIQTAAIRAQYWIAFAHTPANLARRKTRWSEPETRYVPMTRDELVDDAFETAERHIRIMAELTDVLAELAAPRPDPRGDHPDD